MLLVVGWDGACLEQTEAVRRAGRMPVLDRLLRSGKAWRVRSTVPAVTFPAWTSFLTGARPEHHGITDFTIPRPGAYAVRFVNSSHRAMPTVFARMADTGLRVGMYGIPATFPPEGRGVFEICGFDTPLGSTSASRVTHPRALAEQLRSRHGRLGIEGISQSRIDADWHQRVAPQLLEDITLRTRISCELLDAHALDVFVVHFMESDTVAHHFWQFDDEASPRHRVGPRGAIADVYAKLDESLGELILATGGKPDVLLLSDHGSAGASDRTIFWNRWLADRGWLGFYNGGSVSAGLLLKSAALRVLPPALQARVFQMAGPLVDRVESSARFSGIDWTSTRVYSDEVPYFPSLRLNLVGREPSGMVKEAEREALIERLTADLLDARDPIDNLPVVEAVRRREELFDGPFADRYPDLVLELRRPAGYAYGAGSSRGGREREWLRRLRPDEASGAKGSATSGVHGPFGMAVLLRSDAATQGARLGPSSTKGLAAEELPVCTLPDLGVTALALVGLSATSQMQGTSLIEGHGFEGRVVAGHGGPVAANQGPWVEPTASDYSEEEAREVEERLRALGYLP